MNILQAALLGLVQGVTEFFPISSSGHLALIGNLLGAEGTTNLLFVVMLHMGTLLSILTVFYKDILRILFEFAGMIRDLFFNLKLHFSNPMREGHIPYRKILGGSYRKFTALLLVSLIPTVLVACLVSPIVEMLTGIFWHRGWPFYHGTAPVCVILYYGFRQRSEGGKISGRVCNRRLSGIRRFSRNSRLAMTLSSGFLSGFTRKFTIKYAFLLAVPTIIGAMLFEGSRSHAMDVAVGVLPCLTGMAVSAVVGFFMIRLALKVLSRKRNRFFALYCLIIGIISIVGYLR